MEEDANTKSALLTTLPLELLPDILSFLPDKKSLLNAALTCHAFNNAYNSRKTYIASSVLFSRMHESVYQEAVVFYRLVREDWYGAEAGVQAIHNVFAMDRTLDEERIPFDDRMTMEDIQAMHLFHDDVEWWVKRITTNLKRDHPILEADDSPFQLTPAVFNRFKRAIYRLYMYIDFTEKGFASSCASNGRYNRLVSPYEQDGLDENRRYSLGWLEEYRLDRAFCAQYSTAEIEQMINVYELLIAEVSIRKSLCLKKVDSYNTDKSSAIIEDGFEIGTLMRTHTNLPNPGMPMVIQGLGFLREFVNARTYTERLNLMCLVNSNDWRPHVSFRARFPTVDMQLVCDIHRSGLSSEDLKRFANEPDPLWLSRVPFYDDGDVGPQWAWRKFGRHAAKFGGEPYHTSRVARPWGYVFWDCQMLEAANLIRLNEDATRDLMPIIDPRHQIYKPWFRFREWHSPAARQMIALTSYVRAVLQARYHHLAGQSHQD
ncbi:hypothetical protein CEP54_005567 [Fusarium duplospermum]|uniref:F-box domain-containing protein n=1 Tax=Fusarium duplospermum TaxID=1325734 RepID=A0A428QBN3_9HYPO|nr:hypothetical protein CEP54_005567 [Fusarium duplospermum]